MHLTGGPEQEDISDVVLLIKTGGDGKYKLEGKDYTIPTGTYILDFRDVTDALGGPVLVPMKHGSSFDPKYLSIYLGTEQNKYPSLAPEAGDTIIARVLAGKLQDCEVTTAPVSMTYFAETTSLDWNKLTNALNDAYLQALSERAD